ncbi:MAG: DUF3105 domain-containing protein [Chloroflexota bacterium]|nr:DUF3105 domain-containing protein [Chloroflexota bacterium]MDE2921093.1 DUF3105 domain-containing protein [Chloroflexota bacterium]
MASRRRRRTRRQSSAAPSKSRSSSSDKSGKRDQRKGGQRNQQKGGLGRGFWLYMIAVMALFIPLNLYCLNQASPPGPGEETQQQAAAILNSVNDPHEPYATDPPTSGPHVTQLAAHGYRTDTLVDEIQVANLSRGFVIVHFKDAGLEAEMRQLAAEFEGHDVIVQPDANLPAETAVALTAWGRIERLDNYDKGRVYNFVRNYAGLGQPPATPAAGGGG